jgi:hypothetical protein
MIVTEYKLVSPKLDGEIVFTYHGGVLFGVLFKLKRPLNGVQLDIIRKEFHYIESDNMHVAGVLLQAITPERKTTMTTQEKIALWITYYNKFVRQPDGTPVPYTVGAAESGMIKHKDVTELLLNTYFTSNKVLFKNKYSIANYCKFFNELRAEAFGATITTQFPNHYDKELVKKLSGKQLGEYYVWLRSLGLRAKKDPTGNIIDFINGQEPNTTNNSKSEATGSL